MSTCTPTQRSRTAKEDIRTEGGNAAIVAAMKMHPEISYGGKFADLRDWLFESDAPPALGAPPQTAA